MKVGSNGVIDLPCQCAIVRPSGSKFKLEIDKSKISDKDVGEHKFQVVL